MLAPGKSSYRMSCFDESKALEYRFACWLRFEQKLFKVAVARVECSAPPDTSCIFILWPSPVLSKGTAKHLPRQRSARRDARQRVSVVRFDLRENSNVGLREDGAKCCPAVVSPRCDDRLGNDDGAGVCLVLASHHLHLQEEAELGLDHDAGTSVHGITRVLNSLSITKESVGAQVVVHSGPNNKPSVESWAKTASGWTRASPRGPGGRPEAQTGGSKCGRAR